MGKDTHFFKGYHGYHHVPTRWEVRTTVLVASLMAYRRLKTMALQRPSHKLCHRRGNMSHEKKDPWLVRLYRG